MDIILLSLFRPFVGHPALSWEVSAVLGVVFLLACLAKTRYPLIRSVPLLIASLLWLASGFNEREVLIERANIRIDLFLIVPVLFFGTVIAILLSARSVLRAIESNRGT
jgi:hypothetical protein